MLIELMKLILFNVLLLYSLMHCACVGGYQLLMNIPINEFNF